MQNTDKAITDSRTVAGDKYLADSCGKNNAPEKPKAWQQAAQHGETIRDQVLAVTGTDSRTVAGNYNGRNLFGFPCPKGSLADCSEHGKNVDRGETPIKSPSDIGVHFPKQLAADKRRAEYKKRGSGENADPRILGRTDAAIARDAAGQCFHNAFDPVKLETIIASAIKEAKRK